MERDDRVFMSTFNVFLDPAAADSRHRFQHRRGARCLRRQALHGLESILGDQGIYYSSYNGTSWAPQQLVAGIGRAWDASRGTRKQPFHGVEGRRNR